MSARWLAVAVITCGCGGAAPPVRFGGEVAPHAGDYAKALARWTRHVHVQHDYDTAIDADITMMSPEFRGAYLAKVESMRELAPDDRAKLEAAQRDDAAKFVELVVALQTSRWEWNDLSAPRSLWTITLVDDRGRQAQTVEVQYAPLKADDAAALFKGVTPFTRVWRVRFPRMLADGTEIGGAETGTLTVRFAGPLGADHADWRAER